MATQGLARAQLPLAASQMQVTQPGNSTEARSCPLASTRTSWASKQRFISFVTGSHSVLSGSSSNARLTSSKGPYRRQQSA